jgi:hypothetical protein
MIILLIESIKSKISFCINFLNTHKFMVPTWKKICLHNSTEIRKIETQK